MNYWLMIGFNIWGFLAVVISSIQLIGLGIKNNTPYPYLFALFLLAIEAAALTFFFKALAL